MRTKLVNFLEKHKLLPYYSEVSLFLILLSVFLFFATKSEFRKFVFEIMTFSDNPLIFFLFIIIVPLSIIGIIKYAFDTKSVPTDTAKAVIIWFVIVIEIFSALVLFAYNLNSPSIVNLVFAMLNAFNAIYLMGCMKHNFITHKNITSYNARHKELFLGSVIIIVLFLIMMYVYFVAWQVVFSVLISYSVSFNKWLTSSFVKKI